MSKNFEYIWNTNNENTREMNVLTNIQLRVVILE
jgi:hypothetical protein